MEEKVRIVPERGTILFVSVDENEDRCVSSPVASGMRIL
jgi:hypothetical protein